MTRRFGGSLGEELAGIAAVARAAAGTVAAALPEEARTLRLSGPRSAQATWMALAVVLAVAITCAMHLPDVWWSAISAFMSSQATAPASVRKGVLRIIGTVAGASLAVLAVNWVAYDPVACCLVLLVMSGLGILGVVVSPHGYAWLFSGITFALVLLMSLEDPTQAYAIAVYRVMEVVIGTVVAMVVAMAFAPAAEGGAPEAPGFTDLLGAQWPAVLHALRGGLAVAALPLVWSWFDLPSVTGMATTVSVVVAVPKLSDHALDDGPKIVEKAVQRVLGCVLGGVSALLLLGLSFDALLPWLIALFAGVWLCAYLQTSPHGVGYVGTQAGLAFMLTLVQGAGPPTSEVPALNRFAGIVAGLLTLLVVSLLVQPGEDSTSDAAAVREG